MDARSNEEGKRREKTEKKEKMHFQFFFRLFKWRVDRDSLLVFPPLSLSVMCALFTPVSLSHSPPIHLSPAIIHTKTVQPTTTPPTYSSTLLHIEYTREVHVHQFLPCLLSTCTHRNHVTHSYTKCTYVPVLPRSHAVLISSMDTSYLFIFTLLFAAISRHPH
mmetsp:Transcript_33746/g.86535  ORF Transcript_33746/g.86535 Transcript_33746/m.86535 type:complete len:163 (-) Transcript_33746:1299-1787(-)